MRASSNGSPLKVCTHVRMWWLWGGVVVGWLWGGVGVGWLRGDVSSAVCPVYLQGLWGPDSPTGDKGSPLSGGGTKQQVFLQPQGE